MTKPLTDKERAALAMHEIMKREQQVYMQRIEEQRKISNMSDAELKKLIDLTKGKIEGNAKIQIGKG